MDFRNMTIEAILVDFIYPALDEVIGMKENASYIEKSENTALFGDNSVLKSLELVSFIVLVEERINEKLEFGITLTSERAMSRSSTPFRTTGTLAEFVKELLNEETE
jgi:D-alanine--poly(phosphoribitol) ligase subunit 2